MKDKRSWFQAPSIYAVKLQIATLLTIIIGVIMVYNASVAEAFTNFGNKYFFAYQQLKWVGIGLVLTLIFSRIDLKIIKEVSPYLFLGSIILLLLVLIPGIGTKVKGARRWVNLFGFTIQPSEFIKLSLILYLSSWLEKPRTMPQFLSVLGVILFLTMLQPDLGTSIVISSVGFLIYYLSGAPLKKIITIATLGLLLGSMLVFTSSYRRQRLTTFLDPTDDPLGTSYHINQVLIALGSGGLTGVGLGRSRQKHQYLPEATSDSIFAVIGEELGFIGATTVLVLLLYLVLTGFGIAQKSKDQYTKLLAAGISSWIALQLFLNVAAMVALVPLTGIPLPLISYGGSSLITIMIGIGIMINIARSQKL